MGDMSDKRLEGAYESYRRALAAHRPGDPEVPLRIAATRLDLTLLLVEEGVHLPVIVLDQMQADAMQLVAQTFPLAERRTPLTPS